MPPRSAFRVGAEDPDSGPHVYTADIVLTEPSHPPSLSACNLIPMKKRASLHPGPEVLPYISTSRKACLCSAKSKQNNSVELYPDLLGAQLTADLALGEAAQSSWVIYKLGSALLS